MNIPTQAKTGLEWATRPGCCCNSFPESKGCDYRALSQLATAFGQNLTVVPMRGRRSVAPNCLKNGNG